MIYPPINQNIDLSDTDILSDLKKKKKEVKNKKMAPVNKALEYKDKGNNLFKNKDYAKAIECFTNAIQEDPNDHIFYSNRSLC